MPDTINFTDIVGPHPAEPHPLGTHLSSTDNHSAHGVPHRALDDGPLEPIEFVTTVRQWIIKHHTRPEEIERDRRRREALERQGFTDPSGRFPTSPNTQKGNWGEIVLAEYILGACNAQLPVYRLHYNPNVDQSMKGDDVLAFDLDSNPVRILVGEAKFRGTPTKQAVEDIVAALSKSQQSGIPVSMQFIADRLFQEGQEELGKRINECNVLFAQGRLQIDHVGLLVSNKNTAAHVQRNASSTIQRLAVISLGLSNPDKIVAACYEDIENQS